MAHKSGIAPLKDDSGNLVLCDQGKADLLNSYFARSCTVDNGTLPEVLAAQNSDPDSKIELVFFDAGLVVSCILKLKLNSAAGCDGLPPVLCKKLASVLSCPLAMLFNLIIQTGAVPDMWKIANVTPIFKKGVSSCPGNYRPVSITNVLGKLFEAGIKMHLMNFVRTNKLISSAQHGFLANKSTCSNLLEAVNDWTKLLDVRADIVVAYVDLAKAFDRVSIPKLLHRLEHFGICGRLLSCIGSFLIGRQQRVKVGCCFSDLKTVISGVPQGSVLGPTLFILYINDIVKSFPPEVRANLFADDIKAYSGLFGDADRAAFASSLTALSDWCERWQLPISCNKSSLFQISNKHDKSSPRTFSLAGNVLDAPVVIKDLGVNFDNRLSFSGHVTEIIGKSRQRLFLLYKCFLSKDPPTLIHAYKAYVLPLLDYCSPVWSPHLTKDVRRLESVQRLFTKRLHGYEALSYPERLNKAGLCTLELRRLRTDLIFCYKILHRLVDVNIENFFCLDNSTTTRGHSWKLRTGIPRLDSRRFFFSCRVIKIWNGLSTLTVSAPTLNSFKRLLMCEDLSSFLTVLD